MTSPEKPTLHLMSGKERTAEKIADMYDRIMGHKSTPRNIEKIQAILDNRKIGADHRPRSESDSRVPAKGQVPSKEDGK